MARVSTDGRWQAWLEYVPGDESDPLLTPIETTQQTRADVLRWAETLTETYVEGAFSRAVSPARDVLSGFRERRTAAVSCPSRDTRRVRTAARR